MPVMSRLVIRRGLWLALVLTVLGLCLFADCTPLKSSHTLGILLAEISAVLGDPCTQWMVFVCAGIYFLGFLVLRRRLAGTARTGTRWNASLPEEAWLLGLLGVGALVYALRYTEAVKSTQALTLLGGAMLGQAGVVWAQWRGQKLSTEKLKAERGEGESRKQKAEGGGGGSLKSKVQSPKSSDTTMIGVLVVLLAGAAVWRGETGHVFQYRGLGRWSGPWDNPNTFGVLMGVGLVLALGLIMSQVTRQLARNGISKTRHLTRALSPNEAERETCATGNEHPTSNIERRTWCPGCRSRSCLERRGLWEWGW